MRDLPTAEIPVVATEADLASSLGDLGGLGGSRAVALDTEADSLHHYFEKVCLIQITAGEKDLLIDPLAGLDLKPLFAWLAGRPLILHGADYDLRLLDRGFGFRPAEVFDTMIAAQLLGYPEVGLSALLERHFGVALDKRGQKADWSRRPLPSALRTYAAADTHYLPALADHLGGALARRGRLHWHREACSRLVTARWSPREPDPERAWRVRGSQTLSPRGQAMLRALWWWRESEARESDLPPFRILGNEALVALAVQAAEAGDGEFAPRMKLPRTLVGDRRERLQEAVRRARAVGPQAWPVAPKAARPARDRAAEAAATRMRAARDQVAARLEMDAGLLAPRATLLAVAAARPANREELRKLGLLAEWQIEAVGDALLSVLATSG